MRIRLREWARRVLSVLMMTAVIGTEEFLHLLNIPHPEGWWLPLLGSGMAAASVSMWLQGQRKKRVPEPNAEAETSETHPHTCKRCGE